ncbi:MAG: hypothetical protein J6333_00735, partial [Planctomycetes bacterium]|nr:hypothetical protein [Planctomycetota bacterium]
PPAAAPAALLDNETLWARMFEEISARQPTDRAFLAEVYVDHLEGDDLYLSIPGGGAFIFEQLEDPTRKKRLAAAASAVLGRPVRVLLKMREAIVKRGGDDLRARRRELERNPQVQTVLRVFNGAIQDIILGDER